MAIEIETTVINVVVTADSPITVEIPQILEIISGDGGMTDLEVKQANERNANTNEFDDSEKTKLATIEITSPQDGDELYWDDTDGKWKNRRGKVILTQAEYDLLTPDADVLYYITD